MIIEDATEDVRFSGNPLVKGPPHIRFYAGAPLVSSANGYRYGSLCIIDVKPHKDFPSDLYNMLAQFAELTVREIEKDKLALLQKMVKEQRTLPGNLPGTGSPLDSLRSSTVMTDSTDNEWGLSRAADCFLEGVMLLDLSSAADWRVVYTNSAWSTSLRVPRDEAISQGFWEIFSGPGLGPDVCSDAVKMLEPFSLTVSLQSIYRQTPKTVVVDFRPASSAQLGPVGVPAGVPKEPSSTPIFYFAIIQRDGVKSGSKDALLGAPNSVLATQGSGSSASTGPAGGGSNPGSGGGNPSSNRLLVSLSKSVPTAFTDVRLGPLIGRGAYGRVYRGSWNGTTVAVKVMETHDPAVLSANGHGPGEHSNHSAGTSHASQGIFEAILSSSLSHPNVVHTYQYAMRPMERRAMARTASSKSGPGGGAASRPMAHREDDRATPTCEVWIISEFCNRGPLLTAIERGAFLTQPSVQYGQPNLIAVLQTLQEIAAAMQYLHFHDIIHGDLTGGNVLLTASDKDARGFAAKVVDFGLSRVVVEGEWVKTKTLGCAEYMPPELITQGILTKAGDVYSFGVILWEIYVGRRAWEGLQPGAVLKKVASHELLEFPLQTPHRLKLLGERCMAPDPAERPSFREVLTEVNAILGDTMSILQQFLHATSSMNQNGTSSKGDKEEEAPKNG